MTIDTAHWQQRLDLLADKHGVVGAQLGILSAGEVSLGVTGSANPAESIDATTDTLFQIGSITKIWTTTLAMQLVDEGRLDLDAPVVSVVPGLPLRDPGVTVRQLMNHTSGIDGDHFFDTGSGDDALEKFAAIAGDIAQTHPVGATMSYSNVAFALLGRVLEVVEGKVWDDILRDRLIVPLGLRRTWSLTSDVIRYRNAIGHLKFAPTLPMMSSPVWGIPRSMAPAGIINAPVADLLAFAKLHLDGGLAADGTRLLSKASVLAMQTAEITMPDQLTAGSHWGLGWALFDWGGEKCYGHDGSTFGQNAYLRVIPGHDLVVGLLTNGGDSADLYHDLLTEILAQLTGIEVPAQVAPNPEFTGDVSRYPGVYERSGSHFEVAEVDGALQLTVTLSGPAAAMSPEPVSVLPMLPHSEGVFVVQEPGSSSWMPVTFYDVEGAGPYLHYGVRATPKVS